MAALCEEYICSTAPKPPISDELSFGLGHAIDESKLPLNSIRLGQAVWPLLHKMALRYPWKPMDSEKAKMKKFLTSFSWLFPCSNCARDLR